MSDLLTQGQIPKHEFQYYISLTGSRFNSMDFKGYNVQTTIPNINGSTYMRISNYVLFHDTINKKDSWIALIVSRSTNLKQGFQYIYPQNQSDRHKTRFDTGH